MASEWPGLIVAFLGGGTAGTVVKGALDRGTERRRVKREDQLRQQERVRTERQEHMTDPPQLFARFLFEAEEFADYTLAVQIMLTDKGLKRRKRAAQPAWRQIRRLRELLVQVELLANDRSVVDAGEQFIVTGQAWVFLEIVHSDPFPDRVKHRMSLKLEHLPRLRDACRRELGREPLASPPSTAEPTWSDDSESPGGHVGG